MATKVARPATTHTKVARLRGKKAGRFGFGQFGFARFGQGDEHTKVAKPATTHTKTARPT